MTRKGYARPDGRAADVDRDIVTFFQVRLAVGRLEEVVWGGGWRQAWRPRLAGPGWQWLPRARGSTRRCLKSVSIRLARMSCVFPNIAT